MSLQLSAQLASRGFDVTLSVARGETVAILGPNGAGKSTLLSILAGLVRPDTGRAELSGKTLFDLDRRRWLPAHERGISLLAQEPLLFPHLSALENVAFGPRSRGSSRSEAHDNAERWLAAVEATDLAAQRPAKLSGGQAQRVAIARALAPEPNLVLLDEPLAALDVAVLPTLRRMLRTVLAERTVILVTHEVLDALTLADRVIVLNAGKIVEQGATAEVLQRPRHPFTARLAGLNLLTGVRTASGLRLADGTVVSGTALADSRLSAGDLATFPDVFGAPAAAAVRPSAITVHRNRIEAPNCLRVRVQDIEPRGDSVRVRGESIVADLSPGRAAALALAAGDTVWMSFAPAETLIYPL